MTRRRLAIAAGTVFLLGTVFGLAFMNPQVFSLAGTGPAAPKGAQTVVEAEAEPMPGLTPAEVKAKLDRGEPLILADVRGAKSYQTRHISGSQSMPASELESWGPKLNAKELTVFYCSCPDDHSSTATAEMVREKYGYANLAVLTGGLKAWENAGYPMTVEDAGKH